MRPWIQGCLLVCLIGEACALVWNRPTNETSVNVLRFMVEHGLRNCYVATDGPYGLLKCMVQRRIVDFQVLLDQYVLFRPMAIAI